MHRAKLLALLALACAATASAQASSPGLAGDWEGALDAGGAKLRLTLHVVKTDDGLYLGKLVSLDQGNAEIPLGKATVDGRSVSLEFPLVTGSFKGELSADGAELKGTWSQGMPLPLTLKRTANAAAPEPSKSPEKPAVPPFGPPIDALVPAPPIPFRGAAGQSHLIYELHVTNFSPVEQNLSRIEVLDDKGTMASFEGKDLLDNLIQPGKKTDDARKIGPGLRVVAFLTVPLPDGPPPAKLRHRLTVNGATVDLAPVALRAPKAIVIGPPLRGSDWLAGNGPNNRSPHRRALIAVNGRAVIAQRFAIDWVQLKTPNSTFSGDPKDNANYKAYGADVLAVADATVAATKDGIPQNVPGENSRAVPITLDTVAGNHIILDLGGGNYCMYAHLQPGSLKVKVGDKVKRGQVLALLGNSGNSTEPHLHFQVMDGPSPLGSEGLPYLIDSFELLSGQNAGKKQNALPMQNMRVKFD
jgi:murein DD-endopeptidase MepM/ murein hydrolase activator NlpD